LAFLPLAFLKLRPNTDGQMSLICSMTLLTETRTVLFPSGSNALGWLTRIKSKDWPKSFFESFVKPFYDEQALKLDSNDSVTFFHSMESFLVRNFPFGLLRVKVFAPTKISLEIQSLKHNSEQSGLLESWGSLWRL